MTLANKITLARIALIPIFLVLAVLGGTTFDILALVLFIVCSATDFLDGYVARKYNQVTDFGKFVDPLADKLLVCAAMMIFVDRGLMYGWMVFIILAREFIITSLRTVAMGKNRVLAAAWSGKVKTASTMVCLCLMLVFESNLLNVVCIAVIVATTVYSGIEYFAKNLDVFKEAD